MSAEAKILQKLHEMEQREGKLPSFIQLYRRLLQIQGEAKLRFIALEPNLTESTVTDRLRKGIPLLSLEDLSLDWVQVQSLFQEIVSIIARDFPDTSKDIKNLGRIVFDTALLKELVNLWYQGSSLIPIIMRCSVDSELLGFLLTAVLKPFLNAYAERLLPKVDQEHWRRGYCPICGGSPDFAFLDKTVGARWLLCYRCDAEWLFERLRCAYCDNREQTTLSYLADDKGMYRLYLCDKCDTYLKAIDLRHTKSPVLLPLERVMTLDMDKQAQARGYKPATLR